MLARSGALGDVEDVVEAFRRAVAQNVPPQPVIMALWQDEPRFESPEDAERLFSNLLGLFDLVESKEAFELDGPAPRALKPAPVPHPGPAPDPLEAEWLEAASRFLAFAKKDRERLAHAFDNRLDAVVSELDAAGLSDAAFAAVSAATFEVFAVLELGGRPVKVVPLPFVDTALPEPLEIFVDDVIAEAESADELPLPEAEVDATRELARRVAASLLAATSR